MSERKIEMRVIAGNYRHRKLVWPSDTSIRPTKDRVKEAIFSALGDINSLTFLDLYAGSGAMGIEAISRGASYVDFVDKNINAIKCIKQNINTLRIDSNFYHIHQGNDIEILSHFIINNKKFDIIFLDPPYKEGKYKEIVDMIIEYNLLNENAIIITECDKENKLDIECRKTKSYKYGETFVNIYWR